MRALPPLLSPPISASAAMAEPMIGVMSPFFASNDGSKQRGRKKKVLYFSYPLKLSDRAGHRLALSEMNEHKNILLSQNLKPSSH